MNPHALETQCPRGHRPNSPRRTAPLLCGLLLGLTSSALAQGPASDPALIFDPDGRVPLSDYVQLAAYPGGGAPSVLGAYMTVWPDLLDDLVDETTSPPEVPEDIIEVTRISGVGAITHVEPAWVNMTTGGVFVPHLEGTPDYDAIYVVTVPSLGNDLPMATHWDAGHVDSNGVEGRQSTGATDGLTELDLDTSENELYATSFESTLNGDSGHALSGEMYYFNTDEFNLFSDGTAPDPAPATPAYERYLAENWSTTAISELGSLWISDRVRAETGWPILFTNYTDDTGGDELSEMAQEEIPAFQLLQAYIVPYSDATKRSLASILLPPNWEADYPSGLPNGYPALVHAFYDLNANLVDHLYSFATSLGDLYNEDHDQQAVAVYWNGGGAAATYVSNASALPNFALLMDECEADLYVDQTSLVVWGGSRGGGSGALIASNPASHDYEVKALWMAGPEAHLGDAFDRFANPTYTALNASAAVESGFVDAWQDDFTVSSKSGDELSLITLFGTDNVSLIESEKVSGSSYRLNALAANNPGINIVLTSGAHEFTQPFALEVEFFDKLRDRITVPNGMRLRWDAFYRVGHGGVPDEYIPDPGAMLKSTFPGEDPYLSQDLSKNEYHPDPEDPEDIVPIDEGSEFTTVVVEGPVKHGNGQERTWTVSGPPGTEFEIVFYKVDPYDFLELEEFEVNAYDPDACDCDEYGVPPAASENCPPRIAGTLPTETSYNSSNPDEFYSPEISSLVFEVPGSGSDYFTIDTTDASYRGVYVYYMIYTLPGESEQTITTGAATPFRAPFPYGTSLTTPTGDLLPPFVMVFPQADGVVGYNNTKSDPARVVLQNRTGGLATD